MDYQNKTGNNQNRNHKTQRQRKVTLTKEKKTLEEKLEYKSGEK